MGRSGLADLIEELARTRRGLRKDCVRRGYEILNEVVINQVLVSFGSESKTLEVIRRIQDEGTCWCSGTVWHGKTAMRISVSSWATTEADVEMSLAAMLRIANE